MLIKLPSQWSPDDLFDVWSPSSTYHHPSLASFLVSTAQISPSISLNSLQAICLIPSVVSLFLQYFKSSYAHFHSLIHRLFHAHSSPHMTSMLMFLQVISKFGILDFADTALFFTGWRFVATAHQASVLTPFFQQHSLASCLCVAFC